MNPAPSQGFERRFLAKTRDNRQREKFSNAFDDLCGVAGFCDIRYSGAFQPLILDQLAVMYSRALQAEQDINIDIASLSAPWNCNSGLKFTGHASTTFNNHHLNLSNKSADKLDQLREVFPVKSSGRSIHE